MIVGWCVVFVFVCGSLCAGGLLFATCRFLFVCVACAFCVMRVFVDRCLLLVVGCVLIVVCCVLCVVVCCVLRVALCLVCSVCSVFVVCCSSFVV